MADQTEMMDKLLKSNSEQPVQEKTDILKIKLVLGMFI